MATVKRTERGWAGHFICANRCRFRRNTLLETGKIKIVVSTVGLMEKREAGKIEADGFETVGYDRYYETMAFHADPTDRRYHDIDAGRQIDFQSPWSINRRDADDKANDMHEKVVAEITAELLNGNKYDGRAND